MVKRLAHCQDLELHQHRIYEAATADSVEDLFHSAAKAFAADGAVEQ
ncbi:hypothetical protein ACTMTI_01545 [Nonomuraea sp. H19]